MKIVNIAEKKSQTCIDLLHVYDYSFQCINCFINSDNFHQLSLSCVPINFG